MNWFIERVITSVPAVIVVWLLRDVIRSISLVPVIIFCKIIGIDPYQDEHPATTHDLPIDDDSGDSDIAFCERNIDKDYDKKMIWVLELAADNCQCSICFEDIEVGQHLVKGCHTFHQECIKTWLSYSRKRTSPVCRRHVPIKA